MMKPRPIHPLNNPPPDHSRLFQRFQAHGYALQPDPKGRFIQGMVALMGGIDGFTLLYHDPIRRLFANAQVRKGTAHTFKELLGIVKPRDQHDHFASQFHDLVLQGVFFRGYRLACPACDLTTWYGLADVQEQIVCRGCRSHFQMPLEHQFAYAPNELFIQGLREGAMTVLLTALWLANQYPTLEWQSGLIVRRGGQSIDIDLAAMMDEQLILVECKDNFKDRDVGGLIEHLQQMVAFAHEVNAMQLIFATLRENLPQKLTDFLNQSHHPIAIQLLAYENLTTPHQNGP